MPLELVNAMAPSQERQRSAEILIDRLATGIASRLANLLGAPTPGGSVLQMLFTVPQAAIYLGRTTKAVQHMIADGKLPVVRDGRKVQLHRLDLDRWIDENKV